MNRDHFNMFGLLWNAVWIVLEAFFIIHFYLTEKWPMMIFHSVCFCVFIFLFKTHIEEREKIFKGDRHD